MASVYKRVLLKLSGEALGGEEGVFDAGAGQVDPAKLLSGPHKVRNQ